MSFGSAGHDRAARRIGSVVAMLSLMLVAACASPSSGESPFVGRFLADNRPHELIYLDLAPAERSLAGALTIVTIDEELGAQFDTFDVRGVGDLGGAGNLRGAADGTTLTLAADRFLGRADTTLTVARTGEDFTLALPSFTGDTVSLPLRSSSAENLNSLVGAWSAELDDAKHDRDAAVTQAAAVQRHADDLARALADVRTSTRRLRELTADARDALTEDQIGVQNLAGFVLQVKRDSAVDEDDLEARCSATRHRREAGDRASLEGVFAARRSRLSEALDRLETELVTGRRYAAIARDRMLLIDQARVPAPTSPIDLAAPGDDVRALDAYTVAAETARRDHEALSSSDRELRSRSRDLVTEARGVLDAAPDAAECRPAIVVPDEPPPAEPAIVEPAE